MPNRKSWKRIAEVLADAPFDCAGGCPPNTPCPHNVQDADDDWRPLCRACWLAWAERKAGNENG